MTYFNFHGLSTDRWLLYLRAHGSQGFLSKRSDSISSLWRLPRSLSIRIPLRAVSLIIFFGEHVGHSTGPLRRVNYDGIPVIYGGIRLLISKISFQGMALALLRWES